MPARRRHWAIAGGVIAVIAIIAGWRCRAAAPRSDRAAVSAPVRAVPTDDDVRRRVVDEARRALLVDLARHQLAGRVVDAAGAPVEGAEVRLARPARVARSGADGAFAFGDLTAGTFVLEARHDDAYAGPVKARTGGDPITLRLHDAGRVEVACVSAATRAPLADARAGVRMSSMFPGALELEARTDARGVAVFRGMPGSGLEAWCAADGHELRTRFVDTTQEGVWGVTLELTAGVPVRGVVIDEDGAAVAGATIELAASSMPALAGIHGAVRSDADGAFVLPGVAAGRWVVHADHPEHAVGMAPVQVGATEPTPLTIVVGDGVTIAGVVVTRSLAPVPGATIELRFRDGGRTFRTVQADGTGWFEARGLPHDQLQVVAIAGAAASPPALVDTRGDDATDELLLVLEDDATIHGVVVDDRDRPMPDVSIFYVHDTRDDDRATAAGVEVTDDAGRFTLGGLATGEAYVLTAMRPGQRAAISLAARSVGVRATAGDDVTIRMPAGGGIRGHIVLADGGKLPPETRVRLGGTPVRPDAAGRFVVDDLPPETYRVELAGGDLLELARVAEVRAGEVTDLGELTITRGRRVSGSVRDADDRPVPGATVRFAPVGVDGALTTETDERGAYHRVLPTDRDCDVTATAGELGATPAVRLAHGTTAATVELRFARTGRIVGVVLDGGRPAPGRHVLLDRGGPDEPPAAMATTGADGRFELVVGGGDYVVSLVTLGETGPDTFVDRPVTVAPGGETFIELVSASSP